MIILAMHGVPPNDFPSEDIINFFRLHSQFESSSESLSKEQLMKYHFLEKKMKDWPRNRTNDPYFYGSLEVAKHLEKVTQRPVIIGFNEFCSPTIIEAFTKAVKEGANEIIVVTTMLTRGGEHSEKDIPKEIDKARERYPNISIKYLWPIDSFAIANFLKEQISLFEERG
jgi:hypothetical protein